MLGIAVVLCLVKNPIPVKINLSFAVAGVDMGSLWCCPKCLITFLQQIISHTELKQALLMVTFLCLSGHTIDQVDNAKLKMNVFGLRSKTAFLHRQNKSFWNKHTHCFPYNSLFLFV